MSLFAMHPGEAFVAVADSTDILLHLVGGEPTLRFRAERAVTAMAAAHAGLVILDASGLLYWCDTSTGQLVNQHPLEGPGHQLRVAEDGRAGIVGPDRLWLIYAGAAPMTIECQGATALGWSIGGTHVAVGNSSGLVLFYDAKTGARYGKPVNVEAPPRSISWCAQGFWVVAAGNRLIRIEPAGDDAVQITRIPDCEPDNLCCSPDGTLIGMQVADDIAICLDYPGRNTVVQLVYPERKIVGTGLSNRHFGTGLLGGDANMADIFNEQLMSSDPHPGRELVRWLVQVVIERPKV